MSHRLTSLVLEVMTGTTSVDPPEVSLDKKGKRSKNTHVADLNHFAAYLLSVIMSLIK